jgi:tetratricopeptide (TPR) repeat protein
MQGDQGFEASRRALEIGVRSGNELLWVRGAVAHANSLYNTGDLAEAFQLLNQAWQTADELNGTSAAAMAAASAGYCHAFLWNPPETEEWARRELSKSRLQHAPSLRRHLFHNLSHAYVLAGRLKETRQLLINSPCLLVEANVAFYAGDWSQAESTLLRDLEEQGRRAGRPKQEAFAMVWLGRLHHARSEYSKAENLLRRALAIVQGQYLHIEIDIRSELTVLYVDSARANEALPELARLREIINRGEDWRGLAGHVALAEASVAVAEGRFREAQGHFEAAVEIARRFQVPWDEAAALQRWGRALVTAGEHQRAVEKFDAAIDTYRRHGGGQCWIERVMVDKMRSAEPPPETSSGERSGSTEDTFFRREGDYWTIAYEGKTARLKDAKGLHYIAHLLGHPGEEIRALDLVCRVSGVTRESTDVPGSIDLSRTETFAADLGHAGETLDAQAKADYQRRLTELEEELEEAREFKDEERIAKAEDEKEALGRELRGAIGLAGRDRRSASATERGRIAVTKAIRLSLNKIAENDASLGKLLSTTIKTGTVCAYIPDYRFPVSWRL